MKTKLAEVSAPPLPIPKRQSYMVGGDTISVDWRWPGDEPCWRMSSKEGITWEDDGPLNEGGRQLLLQHFGLEEIASHLPLERIMLMSPHQLEKERRALEAQHGLERLEITSSRPGAHVEARLAA
ncbi:hypothetical protein C4585_00755 [Candidatus Parcubacteria bacterium]|nr:MAG: hypothetical protein C4585_00755 [Candidatus Parcubacteria bacterium]